ncbi:MAG: multidrug resistance efflux transporter family protein [Pedobacter sp.]|nr:MAG: multidrug resistance efflux transporter family protein [Pedobacter sp.]
MLSNKNTALLLGIAAALFFAVTFVVNRLMAVEGGSWIWSSSLRFFWMMPFLLMIVLVRGGLTVLFVAIKKDLYYWLLWSTVGFGLFYAPLTYSAIYSPPWLLASTWQFTIIAGIIVAPFIGRSSKVVGKRGYLRPALFSGLILLGIIIMQVGHGQVITTNGMLKGVVPVLIAAFAYPLGNRKMMDMTDAKLDVFQRVLGMVICSMPFWLMISGYEALFGGNFPTQDQYIQTLVVAIFSGVIATALFFSATDRTRNDKKQLAAVEATQSTEIIFAIVGEVIVLNGSVPDFYGMVGIMLVLAGMVLHSLKS